MGHWHLKYEEGNLFNPGSPEYWSFDQGEQIELDLDTGKEKIIPAKEKGFYLIDTVKDIKEFIHIEPARQMYCITYKTRSFDEAKHLPTIKRHMEKYNKEGVMVKAIIQGRCNYGRINFGRAIQLDKPLILNVMTNLKPSCVAVDDIDSIVAQASYLTKRGFSRNVSQRIAEWLEHNKNELAIMQSHELLSSLITILQSEEIEKKKDGLQ
jgi:hypothetical protein